MSKYTCGDCPHFRDGDHPGCILLQLPADRDEVECDIRKAFRVVRDAVRFLNAENKHCNTTGAGRPSLQEQYEL